MAADDAPKPPPRSPTAATSDGELSRMGREAVRQPPDPRLDNELVRMGLIDAVDPAEAEPGQARGKPVAIGPELERLRAELRRVEVALVVLAAVTAVLAIVVVILLMR
jgi:hypothetical protein